MMSVLPYRGYNNKKIDTMDHGMTVALVCNTAEPVLTSYMEFDENDENFKIISTSLAN